MKLTLSNKILCLILDVAVLVVIGVLVAHLWIRHPRLHYDIDRREFPVKGIDISAHNGSIDFARVKTDTVDFVLIKATEGIDFCDANFMHNYLSANAEDLHIGAYHYFRFNTSGTDQARHFINTVSGCDFTLPLVVDVERWGNKSSYDVDTVKHHLKEFIAEVKASGYPIMIYTNKNDYAVFIRDNIQGVPIWICSLSSRPPQIDWTCWQHSHAGKVDGVSGDVDINTFNGDKATFDSRMQKYTVRPTRLECDSVPQTQ